MIPSLCVTPRSASCIGLGLPRNRGLPNHVHSSRFEAGAVCMAQSLLYLDLTRNQFPRQRLDNQVEDLQTTHDRYCPVPNTMQRKIQDFLSNRTARRGKLAYLHSELPKSLRSERIIFLTSRQRQIARCRCTRKRSVLHRMG